MQHLDERTRNRVKTPRSTPLSRLSSSSSSSSIQRVSTDEDEDDEDEEEGGMWIQEEASSAHWLQQEPWERSGLT